MVNIKKRENVMDVRDEKRKKISIALRLQHASQTKILSNKKLPRSL